MTEPVGPPRAGAQFVQLLTLLLDEEPEPAESPVRQAVPAATAAALLCRTRQPPSTLHRRLREQEPGIRQLRLPACEAAHAPLIGAVLLREDGQLTRFDQEARAVLQRLAEAGLPAAGEHVLLTILCVRLAGSDFGIIRRLALGMAQRHPWTFGAESLPLITVMAAPGARFREAERAEEECYRVLRRRGFSSGPALFACTGILSRASMPWEQVLERFLALSRQLDAIGLWPMFPPAIAIVAVAPGAIDAHLRHLETIIRTHPLDPRHALPAPLHHLLHAWFLVSELEPPADDLGAATFLAASGVAVSTADG